MHVAPEELCSMMPTGLGWGAPQRPLGSSEMSPWCKEQSCGATRSLQGPLIRHNRQLKDHRSRSDNKCFGPLHTRQEVKGYEPYGQKQKLPHRHPSNTKQAILSFESAARCPNLSNSSKSLPHVTMRSSRRRARRLKVTCPPRSQMPMQKSALRACEGTETASTAETGQEYFLAQSQR